VQPLNRLQRGATTANNKRQQQKQIGKTPTTSLIGSSAKTQKPIKNKHSREKRNLKIILKIWGLCLPFLNRVVFVFFFDKFCL